MTRKRLKVDYRAIREHAKATRWTPSLIASTAGISRTTLHELFRGREPLATTLKRVCDVIGFPINDAFHTTTTRRTAK